MDCAVGGTFVGVYFFENFEVLQDIGELLPGFFDFRFAQAHAGEGGDVDNFFTR